MNDKITISLRTTFDDISNQYRVEAIVSGFDNEYEAATAMAYLETLLCGDEKSVN